MQIKTLENCLRRTCFFSDFTMIHFVYCMESARSIGHRSDTLTTHVSIYQNNHSYYNTRLERFYIYIEHPGWLLVISLFALSQWENLVLVQKLTIAFL